MLRITSIASLALLLVSSVASAQQSPPPDGQGYEQDPYYGEPPPEEPPPEAEPHEQQEYEDDGGIRIVEQESAEAQAMTAEEGRGFEVGGHLVIPFYAARPDLNPGIGVQGRIGWEFPRGLTVEVNIGVQANRFDEIYDDFLTAAWVGAGLRYAFLNPSAIVPFIGANLQASFWVQCYEDELTGECVGSDTAVGVGVTPLVGIAWELGPRVGLEAGIQATLTFFDEDSDLVRFGGADTVQAYISPFLGGTVYF